MFVKIIAGIFSYGATAYSEPGLPHYRGFTIILRHHVRQDSSEQVISSSQLPLPDNTQHSQQRDIHVAVEFEPTTPASDRPQTYGIDRAATVIGSLLTYLASQIIIMSS